MNCLALEVQATLLRVFPHQWTTESGRLFSTCRSEVSVGVQVSWGLCKSLSRSLREPQGPGWHSGWCPGGGPGNGLTRVGTAAAAHGDVL